MHRFNRLRPSPAMVVASLALLVALGGTGVAAVSALAPNSVGTAQLKANAVTLPKIKNGSVDGTKLKNNAVTSSKVLNGSLTANDFAEGQLPAGPSGPAGPAGPAGPSGISGYQIVTAVGNPGQSLSTSIAVPCPSGKRAIGGGGEIFGSGKGLVAFNDIHPVTDGSGYFVEAAEVQPTLLNWEIRAYAVCANVTS